MSVKYEGLVRETRASHAQVRVGKNGISEGLVREIKRRLKEHKVVKVALPRGVDRRSYALELSRAVGAKMLEVRGFTVILVKEGRD